jgi:uncharacterized radical SAM protein YgiQ
MNEVAKIASLPGFKGYLTDLGGPSANMYRMVSMDKGKCLKCARPSCIFPAVCQNLEINHERLTELYRKVNAAEGIKKAFIGSGVRYDLLFREWNKNAGRAEEEYLEELVKNHVSGRLKVAPEHTSDHILKVMRKVPFRLFLKLKGRFEDIVKKAGLNYEIVPYFISSHPGCTNNDMRELSDEISKLNIRPEQVQDFTPTPMTLSTLMYYTGENPYTGEKVFVATRIEDKKRQKEFFFWYDRKPKHAPSETKQSRPGKKTKPGHRAPVVPNKPKKTKF